MNIKELESLRRSLIARDNVGLNKLYVDCKSSCIKILLSKNYCDKELAEEVYTDAVLVLRRNILSKKVVELSNPTNYLVSVCINLIRNKRKSESRIKDKVEDIRLLFYNNGYNPVSDSGIQSELIERCKAALLTLSQRCQQIITAYYVHEMSMKEIASELGLSSSDVAKTLKSRCYKTWRTAINDMKYEYLRQR